MNSLRSILRFRGKAAGIVAIAITLSSAPASALIVFDPTNYSQNLLQAARALEQIQHQVTSLQNEAQMLINQAKNLTSLPTSLLEQIEGNFSQMKILLGEADKLAYSVQDIDSQFASTYQNFGSDLSSQQLVDGARERWQTSVSAFEHSLKAGAVAADNIEATQEQTSALVGASQSAVGILQATQAGNQLLAVQAKQIADLTAMLAAQGRASALEQARQAAAQEQAQQQFTRFMAGSGYSPSSVKMFHD
ncbi:MULTISPECIES: P-type conjugative transfer protein TrbJ [unclassified Mesorhizobium]|uniref:P-type conjugative transfer protein TrbJ n=1 Tax=unclassified Mesorhizobium TaxID=325217 RepID=UPI000F761827|nr:MULTISPECIES: P-type conjugative transfer protein TrbJ [unclassified Mesorhizobium]AZO05119.1 P-type conjugative transfer protein TrbJ [Mesorhizobium sp. M2A.F.Ca.ET.043.02.1.1]RWB42913.1 MAG: P-type conjugative transfer protein TrbJ [Mesorhizobium sp.]RWB64917.1 MAG: P-type conjugative transfer protein TrbJ [Mesorhizobium sp.]RWB88123.1 MAG: P-type conjugative transfer protein TrbJ [Mesorhizobium sp.]RWD77340.1 MAG: P-type conjugative transfer protein TrbJ [Mesorhizobium sp.]